MSQRLLFVVFFEIEFNKKNKNKNRALRLGFWDLHGTTIKGFFRLNKRKIFFSISFCSSLTHSISLIGPSKCEVERSTAVRFGHTYKPSCDDHGDYNPLQCQQDGQCWCVGNKGQEFQGTRRQGQLPVCGRYCSYQVNKPMFLLM